MHLLHLYVCLYSDFWVSLVTKLIYQKESITHHTIHHIIQTIIFYCGLTIIFWYLHSNPLFFVSMVTTSFCCPWQQLIVSMVTVPKLVAPGNKKFIRSIRSMCSDGHFCFLSYRQILNIDLYRSKSHLNWSVMETDPWSLYLFLYLSTERET